jgi:hypothetical protein
VLTRFRDSVVSSRSSRVGPDRDNNRSRAPQSNEERENIKLEIHRLNQRLTDLAHKQLYDEKISMAILPPEFVSQGGGLRALQEESGYENDRNDDNCKNESVEASESSGHNKDIPRRSEAWKSHDADEHQVV